MTRRMAFLLVLIALIVGALVLLSTMAREQPLTTIESDVRANAL